MSDTIRQKFSVNAAQFDALMVEMLTENDHLRAILERIADGEDGQRLAREALGLGAEQANATDAPQPPCSSEVTIMELRALIADIKAWDIEQHVTIPHKIRVRIQAALSPNRI